MAPTSSAGRIAQELRVLARRARLLMSRVDWWVLAVSPVATGAAARLFTSNPHLVAKGTLETAAIWVTGAFAGSCMLRFAVSREPFFAWAAAVMATLMAREIRFPGASTLVYLALGLLALYALRHLQALWPRLASRVALSGLCLGFFTYAITVATDQRWLRALPREEVWQMQVEETMEIFGHAVIGLALLLAPRVRAAFPAPGSQPAARSPRHARAAGSPRSTSRR